MRQITIKAIRTLPFLLGALLATAWASLTMPQPLAAMVAVVALGLASTTVWLISGLIGPRAMGGRPLRDAVDVTTSEALEQAVQTYSRHLRISPPRLYVSPSMAANAMALGVGPTAAIVLTAGLMQTLGIRELRAVVAHELAHLKRGDTSIYAIAIVTGGWLRLIAGALTVVGLLAVWAIYAGGVVLGAGRLTVRGGALFPRLVERAFWLCDQVTALIAAAVSRQAEHQADHLGAQLAGRQAMLVALCRIDHANAQVESDGWLARLYATHPPTQERIAALREVAP